jgi:adenosylcobinamide kinase/adenosylcobinamide-phosphate guanylyltransferase
MGKLILILGGARSGKSSYAEMLAKELGNDSVLYVATAEAKDEEMRSRIERHQVERPLTWKTLEAPMAISEGIQKTWDGQDVILIDCLTLLASNILLAGAGGDDVPVDVELVQARMLVEVETFVKTIKNLNVTTIIVSNEVGLGLVPPYELGRVYRDVLGRANQNIAKWADEVYFLVAGIPMQVK